MVDYIQFFISLSLSFSLRTLKDGQEKNLFLSCVSDLVTESREVYNHTIYNML